MKATTHTPSRLSERATPALAARSRALDRYGIALLALCLVALSLRLWLIAISPLDPISSTADDGDYYRRALRLAITGQYVDDSWLIRPPLHVFFFAGTIKIGLLFGSLKLGILLAQVAQAVLGTLSVLLGADIARRLFRSRAAALIFGLILAVWFPFVEQPSVLFSELLYLFLFLLHYWLLLRFDARGRTRDLALSGVALGAAALTRSPALYSVAFVGLWLLLRVPGGESSLRWPFAFRRDWPGLSRHIGQVVRRWLVFTICCLAVVGPWTLRNYLTYGHVIPVDTLGQINVWLDLDEVSKRNEHIETLRRLPQSERHIYAMAQAREILAEDPLRPLRNVWPTFQHVWKAQYVEDYFLKDSFYGRPLREAAPLGLAGDLLWVVFVAAGLLGLAGRVREGWHNRMFNLAWIGYSLATVLVFHVEPRYLLPVWTIVALYGAATLARAPQLRNTLASFRLAPSSLLQAALLIAFAALLLSYRDYPAIIGRGAARERLMAEGQRAYTQGDYPAAEASFRAASAAQPVFLDSRTDLALALLAQGRDGEVAAALDGVKLRSAQLLDALASQQAPADKAAELNDAEATAGLDIQRWTLEWLRPAPTRAVQLGRGADLGYIAGFSASESAGDSGFRWLSGEGEVVFPLAEPLAAGDTVALRIAAPGATPLQVRIGGAEAQPIMVTPGQWRVYVLPVPTALVGARELTIELKAPIFVPAFQDPSSTDTRLLSVMISDVWVR